MKLVVTYYYASAATFRRHARIMNARHEIAAVGTDGPSLRPFVVHWTPRKNRLRPPCAR